MNLNPPPRKLFFFFAALTLLCFSLFIYYQGHTLTQLDIPPNKGMGGDSGLYLRYTQYFLGETESIFQFFRLRLLYPLLSLPFYLILRSHEAMLFLPLISAFLTIFVTFKLAKSFGLSEFRAQLAASLLLFSSLFAYHASVAMADMTALLFGMAAILFWKKKKEWPAGALFALALLTRESNLIFFLAALTADLLKRRWRKWMVLPLLVSFLFIPHYFYVVRPAQRDYFQAYPEDTKSFFAEPSHFFSTFLLSTGLIGFLTLLSISKAPSILLLVIFYNILLLTITLTIHRRFWLPSIPALALLASLLCQEKLNEKRTAALFLFIFLFDSNFSVLSLIIRTLLG